MPDCVEQRAIQRARFTAIGVLLCGFQGTAQQRVQLAGICTVLADKIRQQWWLLQQATAPLLGLHLVAFIFGIKALQSMQLGGQRLWIDPAHLAANQLQLAPSRLTLLGRQLPKEFQRVLQRLIPKVHFFELFVGECRKLLAQCLQCRHFALDGAFRRRLQAFFGINLMFLKGASVCHGQ